MAVLVIAPVVLVVTVVIVVSLADWNDNAPPE
jgi:hypothetical protein